jgi:hypothetical protein
VADNCTRSCLLGVTLTLALIAGHAGASDLQADSVRSLSSSGARAITGSGGRAITGSGARAITGSGGRAITGSGGRAITGSGGRAITGSGGRAITGSGHRAVAELDAFAAGVMGPVEAVSLSGTVATLTVLGQQFVTTATLAGSLTHGDYVIVGNDGAEGSAVVYQVGATYVPGASTVAIKGIVAAANQALATVLIGETAVDYAAQLAIDPDLAPSPGQLIQLIGVQPLPEGTVIAAPHSDAGLRQTSIDVQGLTHSEPAGADVADSGRQ